MWINQKQALSDEQQESTQELQISIRSGGIAYLILINKSKGFSQSLSGLQKVVIENICILPKLQICQKTQLSLYPEKFRYFGDTSGLRADR
jgi:hypothetical protein